LSSHLLYFDIRQKKSSLYVYRKMQAQIHKL